MKNLWFYELPFTRLFCFFFVFIIISNIFICRKKRALSDFFIAPNTKWCGSGQTANKYTQLGGASKADKCCRRHDHCKFNIHAMTTKWHYFNYRPFTISHCSCDMRLVFISNPRSKHKQTKRTGKLHKHVIQALMVWNWHFACVWNWNFNNQGLIMLKQYKLEVYVLMLSLRQ